MTFGINLHQIVRGTTASLHPDVPATLHRSTGQTTGGGGQVKATYGEGRPIIVQAQSEKPSELYHSNNVGQENVSRKFYLNSGPSMAELTTGIIREVGRNGDMFQISAGADWFAGTWWLVTALIEDFSRSGWVAVRATLQLNPPDFAGGG